MEKSNAKKEEKKSGGIGAAFKHLFVEEVEVEDSKSEEKSDTPNVPAEKVSVAPAQPIIFNNQTPTMGIVDEKIYQGLHQSLDSNDTDPVSYIKYLRSKKTLDQIPGMLEPLKYQTSFMTMQANSPNLSKEILLKTADLSLQVLENESKAFIVDVNKAKEKIAAKVSLIAQKVAEMQKLQEETTTLQNEVDKSSTKLDASEKNFTYTLEYVKNEILTDKTNINQYLK